MRGGFWRGIIAGSIIGATMKMYMGNDRKNRRFSMGPRRRRQANRMIRGVSKTVRDMIK